ncbi:MAG: hypothetical protein AAGF12_10815 [Myxococcota bacterium]
MTALPLVHAMATMFMVAVIWFVQLVHYPLFAKVGAASFGEFERAHVSKISLIVVPAMLVELASAVGLVMIRTPGVRLWESWLGLALLLFIWATTFFVQVPIHEQLGQGFDPSTIRRLVGSNWFRTIAWTGRGVLVGVFLWRAFSAVHQGPGN